MARLRESIHSGGEPDMSLTSGPEFAGMLDHPFLKVSDETMARMEYVLSRNRQVVSNAEYSWN